MLNYVIRRLLYMGIVLFLVSLLSFFIINLPPDSWIENYALELESSGDIVDQAELDFLLRRYGLDRPLIDQYIHWIVPLVTKGDFGQSFEWGQPVWPLIKERLFLTMTVSLASIIFVYVVSVPIALYSAINQYSIGDYFFSFVGLIGLATPNFLIALVLMIIMLRVFGVTPADCSRRSICARPGAWRSLRIC